MRRGLVALGDSITLGEGGSVAGVTCLSWAQWLARALDLPYTCYARNGAVARGGAAPSSCPVCAPVTTSAASTPGSTTSASPSFDRRRLRA